MSEIGHNSGNMDDTFDVPDSSVEDPDALRVLIERVERLETKIKDSQDDRKDVYGAAKAAGYDPKIMRQIVRLRRMEKEDREEAKMLLGLYEDALGL